MTQSPHAHLPATLTITLWDFTWYTQTGPGGPFPTWTRPSGRPSSGATTRYGSARCRTCCSAPGWTPPRSASPGSAAGTGSGCAGTTSPAGHRRRPRAAARAVPGRGPRHDCRVIVSSWEYQQSPSFLADESGTGRCGRCRRSSGRWRWPTRSPTWSTCSRPKGWTTGWRTSSCTTRSSTVAWPRDLRRGGYSGCGSRWNAASTGSRPGIRGVPVTANYARVPVGEMRGLPRNADVAVFHPYVYGVLGRAGRRVRAPGPHAAVPAGAGVPGTAARRRAGARGLASGGRGRLEAGRHRGTGSGRSTPTTGATRPSGTAGSYDRYGEHRRAMAATLDTWIAVAADLAAQRGSPAGLRRGLGRLHAVARHLRGGPGRRGDLQPRGAGRPRRRCLGHGRLLERGAAAPDVAGRGAAAGVQRHPARLNAPRVLTRPRSPLGERAVVVAPDRVAPGVAGSVGRADRRLVHLDAQAGAGRPAACARRRSGTTRGRRRSRAGRRPSL